MKTPLAIFAMLSSAALDDVRLPAIVSDHVVLQRDRPLSVWGRADAANGRKMVAVRYAYSGIPGGANLYNRAGLPASPFRTDNW